MGCWNHTCAITNLPIHHGEEVEVILLQSSEVGTSRCYSNAYHSPLPLTFQGLYDDYGGVEECKGKTIKLILDSIRHNLVELDLGENKYHDIEIKKADLNIETLFRFDHEDRLLIKNRFKNIQIHPDSVDVKIKHIVVKKDVYDTIVETTKIEHWDSSVELTDYPMLKKASKIFTKDLDIMLNADEGSVDSIKWMMSNKIGNSIVGQRLSSEYSGSLSTTYPLNVVQVLIDLRKAKDNRYTSVLDNAVRFSIFTSFMDGARKSWHIPCGLGSQDDNTTHQVSLANITITAAEKYNKRWNEE